MERFDALYIGLAAAAGQGRILSYKDAGFLVGLPPESFELWSLLGEVTRRSERERCVALSCIVVNEQGVPGAAFFDLLEELRHTKITDRDRAWIEEIKRTHSNFQKGRTDAER